MNPSEVPQHLKTDPMRRLAHGYPEAREERESRLASMKESFADGIEALRNGSQQKGTHRCQLLDDEVHLVRKGDEGASSCFVIYADYQGSYRVSGGMSSSWNVWVQPVERNVAHQVQTLCNQPEEDRRDLGLPSSSMLMCGVLAGEKAEQLSQSGSISLEAVRDMFQFYRQSSECRHSSLF